MNTPFEVDDDTLMAYADGELDASQTAQVEQLLQQDAAAAARVAQHRALRMQLQTGLADVLSEPVPERLLQSLQPQAANPNIGGNVVDLVRLQERKAVSSARRWQTREWSALAASLVAGVVIGIYALNFTSSSLLTVRDGSLLAQGRLANALTTQLAGNMAADPSIHIGISFRNHAGEYCRSFAVQETHELAGLACRSQGGWRMQMLTESAAGNTGEFRQAGSGTPTAVLALIEQQISGEPLDANAEVAALRSGWK